MGNVTRGYDPIAGDDILRVNGKIILQDIEIKEFKPMPYQPNSTAKDVETLVADFNALLQKLRDIGLMARS